MSITIISTPQQYTPAYNDQMILVSGTNTAYNSYKYVFDLYDSANTRITSIPSIKIPARPTDGWCLFNVGRIIEGYVNTDIALETSGTATVKRNSNSYYGYKVKVGEEFDVSTSGTTTYPALASTSVIYAYNGIIDFIPFKSYDMNDYLISSNVSQPGKFLTSATYVSTSLRTSKINLDENAWLHFMQDVAGKADNFVITTTDTSVVNRTYRIDNPYKTSSASDKFLRIPSGTRNLNYIPNSSFTSGIQPIITSTTIAYVISLADSVNALVGEAYTFIVSDVIPGITAAVPNLGYYSQSPTYPKYRVHFLNKLGGFDSYTFNRPSKKNESIQRSTYKKMYGTTSGAYSYNTYDRGSVVFNTSIKDTIQLNTDWINDEECLWLEQLMTSPEVYIEQDSALVAINPIGNSYETKQKVSQKLFTIAIEFEYSYNRYRQRF